MAYCAIQTKAPNNWRSHLLNYRRNRILPVSCRTLLTSWRPGYTVNPAILALLGALALGAALGGAKDAYEGSLPAALAAALLAGGCACANGLAVDEGAGDGVLKLRWAGRADLQIDGIVDLCLLHG